MRRKQKPAYLLHRPTHQARVRLNGKDHYLGEYGTPESYARYEQLVAEWFRQGDGDALTLTIDELCIRYVDQADGYYRHPDGTPTGTIHNVRESLKYLVRMYGTVLSLDFGPKKLKAVRNAMIEDGHCRTNINRLVGWIKRAFRWAVSEELVPTRVYEGLRTVDSLRKGRTKAEESESIEPVDLATVNATLPHLPHVVSDMVHVQLLTGARPTEVCLMRPSDITLGTDGLWCYRPSRHKTAHRAKERRIYIGPKAQEILRPYMECDPGASCFSPAESEKERNAKRRENRQAPMTPSQAVRQPKANRKRSPATTYNKDSYGRAVRRACLKAGVDPWSPGQLRHARSEYIEAQFGREAAQCVLGHCDPATTAIYSEAEERNFETAARIMQEIG